MTALSRLTDVQARDGALVSRKDIEERFVQLNEFSVSAINSRASTYGTNFIMKGLGQAYQDAS